MQFEVGIISVSQYKIIRAFITVNISDILVNYSTPSGFLTRSVCIRPRF